MPMHAPVLQWQFIVVNPLEDIYENLNFFKKKIQYVVWDVHVLHGMHILSGFVQFTKPRYASFCQTMIPEADWCPSYDTVGEVKKHYCDPNHARHTGPYEMGTPMENSTSLPEDLGRLTVSKPIDIPNSAFKHYESSSDKDEESSDGEYKVIEVSC